MIINDFNLWESPVRKIAAKVEVFNASALVATYAHTDVLKSFTVERVGENSKFFGFGVCQKANIKLIDINKEINLTTANSFKLYLYNEMGDGDYTNYFTTFHITEVHRDEITNELSITAYDKLYAATAHTVAEIGLNTPYTIKNVATACAEFLGATGIIINGENNKEVFNTEYPDGANFDGAESVREVLNAVAEATQMVYYINYEDKLVFKKPGTIYSWKDGVDGGTVFYNQIINLKSKTNRRLTAICSATELGDNVIATTGVTGTTQYVRDNPFWELREDIDVVVENALVRIGGLTLNQFELEWTGNPGIEPGDFIFIEDGEGNGSVSILVNDVIEYAGYLKQKTSWIYEDNDGESVDNPSTLGAALKKTFAKVDKANKEIEIVAGEVAAIKLTTDAITASVTELDNNMTDLISEVNTKMTAEDVSISIKTALEDGVERVTTTTGFTFNEEGLHINKDNSEITTTITEDGMTVYRDNKEVLAANNLGVKAEDLHATTFLTIGKNSRLENYGSNRTGCFWIGG